MERSKIGKNIVLLASRAATANAAMENVNEGLANTFLDTIINFMDESWKCNITVDEVLSNNKRFIQHFLQYSTMLVIQYSVKGQKGYPKKSFLSLIAIEIYVFWINILHITITPR